MGIRNFGILNQPNDINNQVMQATAENSFIREDTVNAHEHPSNATLCSWQQTDPALFGLEGYNKKKLACYNNGTGLTAEELDTVTEFSSSLGKPGGVDGNKGKGALLSSLRINQSGLIWISCAENPYTNERRVSRAVMKGEPEIMKWGKDELYCPKADEDCTVQDITDIVEANSQVLGDNFDINKDWTMKIYCGINPKQDTINEPYAPGEKLPDGWLVKELSRRFPILPKDFEIRVEDCLRTKNQTRPNFWPILEIIKTGNSKHKFEFETVTVTSSGAKSMGKKIPFYTDPGQINVTFVYDPPAEEKGQDYCWSHHIARQGITSTYSGVIWKDELYGYVGPIPKGGNNWRQMAPACGVLNGYKKFRIFVSLPNDGKYANDENRIKLNRIKASGDPEEIKLSDYYTEIKLAMPDWFKAKMDAEAPKATTLDDIRKLLTDKMKEVRVYQSADKVVTGNNKGSKPKPNPNPDPKPNPNPNPNPNPSGQSGMTPNPEGAYRMIREFPEIKMIAGKGHGLPLDESFHHMAGEYIHKENILYVNQDYDAFEKLASTIKDELNADERVEDDIKTYCQNAIIYSQLGSGMVVSFLKKNMAGFKDEADYKASISARQLTRYADCWMLGEYKNSSLYKSLKTRVDAKLKEPKEFTPKAHWDTQKATI
jgi:hypothetical protein